MGLRSFGGICGGGTNKLEVVEMKLILHSFYPRGGQSHQPVQLDECLRQIIGQWSLAKVISDHCSNEFSLDVKQWGLIGKQQVYDVTRTTSSSQLNLLLTSSQY